MKTDKQTKIIALVAMIIAIGGLSIAFAALNQDLTIDGSASVSQIGFKVRFENLVEQTPVGSVTVNTSPTISSNSAHIGDFDVAFAAPGSSVSYTATIHNAGTIDAIIDSINIPAPTCTGNGVNATVDASNVCNHIEYTLTYADGSAITSGQTLDAGASVNVILTLEYSSGVTVAELPAESVSISNLAITIGYIQS